MNSWSIRTLPHNDEHQRSASIAGYNEMINGHYNPYNRLSNQYHTSFMDLNKMTANSMEERQQYPWQNNVITSQSLQNYPLSKNQNSGDNAFKTAIAKMKESSIYRLGTVEKNSKPTVTGQSFLHQTPDNFYNRNCMTLQPKKTMLDAQLPNLSHKIFKCNSTAEHGRDGIISTNLPFIDSVSETESDKNYKDNQYRSVSNLYSDHTQWQENSMSKKYINSQKKNHSSNSTKNHSGKHIVIPAYKSTKQIYEKEKLPEVSEQHISPKNIFKAQSALPGYDQDKIYKEDYESDTLSSVNDINLREEAWANDRNNNKIMTKSLNLTSDKPPLKKIHRGLSQKHLDRYPLTCQPELVITPAKGMSGLYKKTIPTSSKGKPISNIPVDFQKLHSAFLDQKNEIKHLKNELEEKKSYIIKLESEIRSYEPWR